MSEIIEQLNYGAAWWIVIGTAILSLIQIAPIKVNPWSFIATGIGRALNKEIFDKLDRNEERTIELKDDIDELKTYIEHVDDKIDEDRAITARVRILRFNDELLEEKRHSKEAYDQVLIDIDNYELYCNQRPDFKNNRTKMSAANIIASYETRLKKHDFLTPVSYKE